jgi:hypothetical protein
MLWLAGIRDPFAIGLIIGTNTVYNHAYGIIAGSLMIAIIGSALGLLPGTADKE